MKEAKFAAGVFGLITACLIGGGAVAYNAAPQVSTRDDFVIVEPANEELAAAAETSAKTTTASVKSKKSNSSITNRSLSYSSVDNVSKTVYTVTTTAAAAAIEVMTTTEPPTEAETVTEAPTEAETEYYYYEEPTYLEEPQTEAETEAPSEEETAAPEETVTEAETEAPATAAPTEAVQEANADTTANELPISESDFILLCNVVGHEAGSYWISEYDKACVVEVVMNRVNSSRFPNTIYGVLTQRNQFSGCGSYVNLGTYSGYVTESVKNAVKLYFNDPSQFSQGYLSFWGDGTGNHFS